MISYPLAAMLLVPSGDKRLTIHCLIGWAIALCLTGVFWKRVSQLDGLKKTISSILIVGAPWFILALLVHLKL